MFTLDAVPLVSVTVCDWTAPTATLPKASLVMLGASCPSATPVPVSVMFGAVVEASLVIVAVALKGPAALGVNLMLTCMLCPGATVTGRLGAVSVKYWLDIVTVLMVTEAVPELVAAKVVVLLLPNATLPKSRIAVLRDKLLVCVGWVDFELTELIPWQPTRKVRAKRMARVSARSQRFIAES